MPSRLVVAAAVLAVTGSVGSLLAAPAAEATAPPYHPSRLSHVGDARQIVVVTSGSWGTSYATLRTYGKGADGVWRARFAPMKARVGYRGFAPARQRRQNSGQTPAGTFRITRGFGAYADPGTALPYRVFDRNDWWPYDPRSPRTYNVYQTRRVSGAVWRRSWAEHLWDYYQQYRYVTVINYNMPGGVYYRDGRWLARDPADTRKGGGIFLHVDGPGATAGCVSVRYRGMRAVLRWLDPAKRPRITMGPVSAITRM